MATLKNKGPARIVAVRTRGSLTYGISGIQLIFDHEGLASPVIDAGRQGTD